MARVTLYRGIALLQFYADNNPAYIQEQLAKTYSDVFLLDITAPLAPNGKEWEDVTHFEIEEDLIPDADDRAEEEEYADRILDGRVKL